MKKLKKTALSAVLVASFSTVHAAEWSYDGATGPENWGSLTQEFAACAQGHNQSPIDIADTIPAKLSPLVINYHDGASEIVNNGHTVQVNFREGSSIEVDGRAFELKQFHFHTPSENTLDGRHMAMEAHLVHADAQGNLAVVAVFFREGERNEWLSRFWKHLPLQAGATQAIEASRSAEGILPAKQDYYRFNGSLTTPPCTEGVRWLVMKQPVEASAEQIKQFADSIGHDNNRPVQPVNARPVLK